MASKKGNFRFSTKVMLLTLLLSILPLLLIYYQMTEHLKRMQVFMTNDAYSFAMTLEKVLEEKSIEERAEEYAQRTSREYEYASTKLLMTLLTLIVTVSLLLMILARYFARRLTHSIESLAAGFKKWDGMTPMPVVVEGNDEIAELAHQFSMVTDKVARLRAEAAERQVALERADKELMKFTLSLEDQIDKRTEKLQSALFKLRTLDKTKDEFLTLITHELKTPLTSISACAEALSGHVELGDEAQKKFISIIHDESERLTRLINEVLDYSRISAGKLPIMFRKIDLVRLVERSVLQQRPSAELKGIRLEYFRPDPLDPRLQEVRTDPDRIQQVMTNLLNNALKFTDEGGRVRVKIDILGRSEQGRQTDFVQVQVSDSGIGISEEDRSKVFERFAQAGKMEHHSEGTGLGMPIARGIIKEHGGKIWFTSQKEKGTTFYFTLPLESTDKIEIGKPEPGNVTGHSETKGDE